MATQGGQELELIRRSEMTREAVEKGRAVAKKAIRGARRDLKGKDRLEVLSAVEKELEAELEGPLLAVAKSAAFVEFDRRTIGRRTSERRRPWTKREK